MGADETEADDLMQETFLRVARRTTRPHSKIAALMRFDTAVSGSVGGHSARWNCTTSMVSRIATRRMP
jgi:hypothetical protein